MAFAVKADLCSSGRCYYIGVIERAASGYAEASTRLDNAVGRGSGDW